MSPDNHVLTTYTASSKRVSLEHGLYFISTPIGSARDITLRALDILSVADVLVAEDTRSLRHLMDIHGIQLAQRNIIAGHEHNEKKVAALVAQEIKNGKVALYASEAGTPLISDPGFVIAREVIAQGLCVFAAPGPSAALCALTVSGIPADKFYFAGFLPRDKKSKKELLKTIAQIKAAIIIYESPKRVHQTLADLRETFGKDRKAALCRELTKKYEEIVRGPLGSLCDGVAGRDFKGEIVIVLDRAQDKVVDPHELEQTLKDAMKKMPLKEAASFIAELYGTPRRDVYQQALALKKTHKEV